MMRVGCAISNMLNKPLREVPVPFLLGLAGWYRQFAPYELLRLLKQFEIVDAAFHK